ncbi:MULTISPECIES: response regulator [Ochrobactrum]|jgi:two-component system response regulator AdeR|uniref:Flagellar transcriptional regulator FtcR n=1 Tax=Ochrobactrum quorumnocens TaxID=271865 RepID=A0A5N1JUN7_9HYPH|nr:MULTISPECIES: response regulator [Brucella/Ochrobactrum group]KAA9361528.1 response regulator transcription factor [[Ochrobactrum] quorumnocens]MBD7993028.1 response regulator transcription factor [Ochrobactrum gallinarum]MDH7793603.1 two-component system response regulator AdeR [Ochrobactrum sp. AN78]
MENSLVLIVEDEPDIAHILSAYLEREGYRTVRAGDGETALQHHAFLSPDIVLLDVRLPKLDGFSVLGRLRQSHNTPVIMVTALAEDLDRLSGLRLGADDYIVKPFNPQEVVARVKAVLRRSQGELDQTIRRFGNFEVDFKAYTAFVHQGKGRVALQLTLSEFRILAYMIRRPTHAFERADLLDACLPESEALARTVDTHISNLRRKVEELGQVGFFCAVRGVGYRFCEPR